MKKLVLLIVFVKSCVFLKTLKNSVFRKNTAVAIQTLYVNKKQKIDEN